jgi:multidrug efflux pump subunit AcrA (membrane-fusion protein)
MKRFSWIKNNFISLSSLTLIGLLAVLGFTIRANKDENGRETALVERGTILESVYGIGTVMAEKSFQLKSGVAGIIQKIYVREGDFVKRGAPLVDLEDTALLTAPFSGTVTWLPFKTGEVVFPQAVILSLVDLQHRYMVVSLEQKAALKVHAHQKARISFDNMRESVSDGMVEVIYSQGNSFLVRIGIRRLPLQILPGMTGDVAITISERKDVLLVPTASIDDGVVWIKRGAAKPQRVEIALGIVDGEKAEVAGALTSGELVVLPQKAKP